MADAFQKLKNSVNRGITTISVKTSSSFEKTTINTHIETIKNEIIKLTSKLGEDVYNCWLNGEDSIMAFSEKMREETVYLVLIIKKYQDLVSVLTVEPGMIVL